MATTSAMNMGFSNYTPEQWQKYLNDTETSFQRQSQLQGLQKQYLPNLFGGSNTTAITGANNGSGSSNSSSSTGSLFGGLDGTWQGYVDQAKDLANFRLGLDQKQADFSYGLRGKEADDNLRRTTQLRATDFGYQQQGADADLRRTTELRGTDFGYNYKLADQQIAGQKDLTNIQQNATTDRLQRQLDNQKAMQEAGFGQQNLFRAQSAALALRGLR